MTEIDPYDVLGIDPDATPQQIRQAFRRAVRRDHPDSSTGSDGAAVRDVILAYRALVERLGSVSGDPMATGSDVPGRSGARRIAVRRDRAGHASSSRSRPQVCSSCCGGGVAWSRVVCRTCGGDGVVTLLDVRRALTQRCAACAGRGGRPVLARCATCGGTGTEG